MPATDQQWAAFFTGDYNLLVDDLGVTTATLTFERTGTPHFLKVSIEAKEHNWHDIGHCGFALKPIHNHDYAWPHQGDLLPGGHLRGKFTHPSYGFIWLSLICWEIVLGPNGWVHGFKPDGKGVVIRFEGQTTGNTGTLNSRVWFSSTGVKIKNRPDTNYPWNLP